MSTDLVPATRDFLGETFTPSEAEILRSVFDEDASLELAIPEDIDPAKLWTSLEVCTKLSRTIQHASDKVKPLVGRMLIVMQAYPQLYQERGYKHYDDFMTRGMWDLFGIARSEAYYCVRIARTFPELTTGEFREIGVCKLQAATRAVEQGYPKDKVLDQALKTPLPEYKTWIAKITGSERTDFDAGCVQIYCTKTVEEGWKHFKNNKTIEQFKHLHGITSDGELLSAMIQECTMEWMAQMEQIKRDHAA